MKTSTKFIVTTALLGTLGLASIAHLVQAAQVKIPSATMSAQRASHQKTQVSDGDGETKDDALAQAKEEPETGDSAKEQADNQQEAAKLQPLAKISPQKAQMAAEAVQGGKAKSVKLENENGNLVYAVVIGQKEVTVDAGNGRVLCQSDRYWTPI